MDNSLFKKVFFIVNPNSGNNAKDGLEKIIEEHSTRLGFDYEIQKVESDASLKIKNAIAAFKPDLVAACGGDGTVNLAASILDSTGIPLLIVPFGSANGMAKEIQINSIEQSLELLSNGTTLTIDLIKINGKTCIHLADAGLNARIVKRFEADGRRGIITYAKHLFGEMFLLKQYRFVIRYCDSIIKRKAVSLTFANASKYGTGAVINATGKLNDGKFEIVIVKPFPSRKLFSIAWKMFSGKLQTSEYVEVLRCTDAVVTCNKKTTFQIDGEITGKIKEFTAKIVPGALTLVVPPKAGL
ncbi:diacylglycerol kinase [Pedobacter sp. HMF7647]|uniref:Diacylglycerol kinase n=1 Tax=Hufsiella arboris TaxID=2695275 RepID=A0A7K1YCQ3_9SPHI|nr:diacylglycerol kinase family protein [Hufsiella arboris]MXV52220.1 diacylglycerol kinase [Hufsiella arboris]